MESKMKKTNIFNAFLIVCLTTILSGCDQEQRQKEAQIKIVNIIKTDIDAEVKKLDDNLSKGNQEILYTNNQNRISEIYKSLKYEYSLIEERCREYHVYTNFNSFVKCDSLFDANKYYLNSIFSILEKQLKKNDIEAFIALYSYYNDNASDRTQDEIDSLRDKYIDTLIKLTEENKQNSTLLYLTGREYSKGNSIIYNYKKSMEYIYQAWLLGNTEAPKVAVITYSNMNDIKNAYLWKLRCMSTCNEHAIRLRFLDSEKSEIPYLESKLSVEEMKSIQELAADKKIAYVEL